MVKLNCSVEEAKFKIDVFCDIWENQYDINGVDNLRERLYGYIDSPNLFAHLYA